MSARLPLDEQLTALRTTLSRNRTLLEVLGLPDWYLTAGCLFQTIWNTVTGRPPTHGIKDYDVFYHDDTDLSWEAEDAVIRAGTDVFNLVVRPNPLQAPREVYETKAARWQRHWPELTILPWPGSTAKSG
jgi:hypothetical protein